MYSFFCIRITAKLSSCDRPYGLQCLKHLSGPVEEGLLTPALTGSSSSWSKKRFPHFFYFHWAALGDWEPGRDTEQGYGNRQMHSSKHQCTVIREFVDQIMCLCKSVPWGLKKGRSPALLIIGRAAFMLCGFQIRFPTGQVLTSRSPGRTSCQRGEKMLKYHPRQLADTLGTLFSSQKGGLCTAKIWPQVNLGSFPKV